MAGKGTYELAGRWYASRTRDDGRFVDVKYGEGRNKPMPDNMKAPNPSRLVNPGLPDAFDADELVHLREVPGPRRWARGDWESWTAELW